LVCSQLFFPHRIFASGNERVPVRLNGKYKFGYAIDNGDNLHMLYDLVNQSDQEQTYYVVMVSKSWHHSCGAFCLLPRCFPKTSSFGNFTIRYDNKADINYINGNGFLKLRQVIVAHAWCGWTLMAAVIPA
jgi:hypothetical protein